MHLLHVHTYARRLPSPYLKGPRLIAAEVFGIRSGEPERRPKPEGPTSATDQRLNRSLNHFVGAGEGRWRDTSACGYIHGHAGVVNVIST